MKRSSLNNSSPNMIICPRCQQIPLIKLINPPNFIISVNCKCSFTENISLDEFLNQINKNYEQLPKRYCEMKNNHNTKLAEQYCYICKKWLCKKCIELHEQRFAGHERTKNSLFIGKYCKSHINNEIKLHCETCNLDLCEQCLENHDETHIIQVVEFFLNKEGYDNLSKIIIQNQEISQYYTQIYTEVFNELNFQIGKLNSAYEKWKKMNSNVIRLINVLIENYKNIKNYYTIANINNNCGITFEKCNYDKTNTSVENIDNIVNFLQTNITIKQNIKQQLEQEYKEDNSVENDINDNKSIKEEEYSSFKKPEWVSLLGTFSTKLKCMLLFQNNRLALSSEEDTDLLIQNIEDNVLNPSMTIVKAHFKPIEYLSEIEGSLVSSSLDGTIKFWKVNDDSYELHKILIDHFSPVYQVIPITKNVFASCSEDGSIFVWDLEPIGRKEKLMKHSEVTSILYLTHYNMLASSGKDNKLIFWDIKNMHEVSSMDSIESAIQSTLVEYEDCIIVGNNKVINIIEIDTFTKQYTIKLTTDIDKNISILDCLLIFDDNLLIGSNTTMHCYSMRLNLLIGKIEKKIINVKAMVKFNESQIIAIHNDNEISLFK